MKNFLAIVGAIFLIQFVLGAVVPGVNFHVIFANDIATQRWHDRLAKEMAIKIESNTNSKQGVL